MTHHAAAESSATGARTAEPGDDDFAALVSGCAVGVDDDRGRDGVLGRASGPA